MDTDNICGTSKLAICALALILSSVIFETIFLIVGKRIIGRRLSSGPFLLSGLCNGTRIPLPMDISSLCVKQRLSILVISSCSNGEPYFISSEFILSYPVGLLLFSFLTHICTS